MLGEIRCKRSEEVIGMEAWSHGGLLGHAFAFSFSGAQGFVGGR